jgi:hypothetical protein
VKWGTCNLPLLIASASGSVDQTKCLTPASLAARTAAVACLSSLVPCSWKLVTVQESHKADLGGILAADPREPRVAKAVADHSLLADGSAAQRRYVLVEQRRDPQADEIQTCPAQHFFGEPMRAAEVARAVGARSSVGHHDDSFSTV